MPYPVFSLAALVPWTYFATAASNGSASLVGSQHLIAKVYFPRVLVPLAAVLMPAVDLVISFGMLLVLLAWYHVVPTAGVVLLPLYGLLGVLTAFAVTLWTSALSVRYRDARYVLPFVIQIWLFVTPVAYPSSLVPEKWRALYGLNPMAGVVEGFRWALLKQHAVSGGMLGLSIAVTVIVLITGLFYFRRMEKGFADVV